MPSHPTPTPDRTSVGVVIVDHGSRREESNRMLLEVVRRFTESGTYEIVEPAHMEIAQPTIEQAFDRCVQRGAQSVVVMPYFLLPGKHWDEDIPRLSAQAAAKHPGVKYMITAPIGLHPMMGQVIQARVDYCLAHSGGSAPECEVCAGSGKCTMKHC